MVLIRTIYQFLDATGCCDFPSEMYFSPTGTTGQLWCNSK